MQNLEAILKTLLLKRNEQNEESINAIAEPLTRVCLDCLEPECLAQRIAEFRQRCADAGHDDVVALLDNSTDGLSGVAG